MNKYIVVYLACNNVVRWAEITASQESEAKLYLYQTMGAFIDGIIDVKLKSEV